MSLDLTHTLLQAVAHPERVRSIVDRLNRPLSLQYYIFVAAAAGLIVLAWIVIARAYRQRHQPPALCSESSLFDELADAHQLSPLQRSLLGDLAGVLDLPSPTYLFVSPSRFHAAASHLLGRPQADDEALRMQLKGLERRLFGDPLG